MKQTFQEADKNGDGLLNIEEIQQLLHKLNVSLPRRKVRQMFQVCARGAGAMPDPEQDLQLGNKHPALPSSFKVLPFVAKRRQNIV